MRKRDRVIPLRLTSRELEYIDAQAAASGFPREKYMRLVLMGAEVKAKPCTHHADSLRLLSGLCNNANQLAHVANSTGQAGQASIDEMTRIALAAWKEIMARW